MEQLVSDLRFAVRTLVKHRAYTFVAVLTLGLGIGANTAVFSAIDGVLLKPLPYANANRLVLIRQSAPLAGRANTGVAVKELYDYREQTRTFDALVEYHQMNFDLLKHGEPDRVNVGVVSHDFFDVLGIRPILGRSFRTADDEKGADAVLILSYSYWQTKFGGDPHIVGQVFEMNDRPHTVVGVLPNVPHYPQENDVYMPVSACPFRAAAEQRLAQNRRTFSILTVFGRLKPGVSRAQAAADVETVCSRFTRDNPKDYRPGAGFMATTPGVQDELTRNARPMLVILIGTTALVLLIASANVASLTLARLLHRDREFAVRAALGAGRGRIVRQLLTESALVGVAGGVVGLLFAGATLSMLTSFVGRFTSRTSEIAIDPQVLGFALLVSVATGIVFGTLPALQSRVDLAGAMKQGGRSGEGATGRRLQSLLVVAQVAVSVVLLVGAGLLLSSLYRLSQVDPGYHAERVMAAEAYTNFSKYPDAQSQLRFYEPVMARLAAEPGVVSVAVTNAVPLSATQPGSSPFEIEGRATDDPDKRPTADVRVVSPGYFQTLGIPLVQGRAFTDLDRRDGPPVVMLNQSMRRYWDRGEPVGSRVSFDGGQTWLTVVGIVGDIRQFGLAQPSVAQAYVPLSQSGGLAGRFLVRTSGDPLSAAKMIRDDVHAVDPNMPVENIQSLEALREHYLATPKLTAFLLALFATLALAVTVAGIGGAIATSVSRRTAEFGLRMALGAGRPRVLRQVIGQGLTLVACGLAVGVVASLALTRVLAAYLFDTRPADPLILALVALTFVAAGLGACLGPAWRATSVDPMLALRTE